MSPFEAVYARCLDLVPNLEMQPGKAVQAARCIADWLAAGCDADLDILPAINGAFARMRGRPSSVAYFDRAVREAKDRRCGSAERDLRKARQIAWVRERMPQRYECDSHLRGWLESYERKHGAVSCVYTTKG